MSGSRPGLAAQLVPNLLAGLTVSFVAISLGAAFGVLSGRGPFAGIVSAGIIAFVTALLGGTRIQCSGPTAPMTAVTAVVVAYAFGELLRAAPDTNPDHFVNITLLMTGGLLVVAALLRLGRYIRLVPRVVISGFMNGIAILIWVDQVRKLLGLGGVTPFQGGALANVLVAVATLALIFGLPKLAVRYAPRLARHLPATLIVIVAMTALVQASGLDVELVKLNTTITSAGDFVDVIRRNVPVDVMTLPLLTALRFALQLAMLCYLDTLLTSLVVDKLTHEDTLQDRELAAQGLGNGLVAFVGGIPGAQATIRSVLIIKEHATLRIAGVVVGVFVLIEMILFQDLLNLVPQAVFSGVLFKVGYDVFDWRPVTGYVRGRVLGRGGDGDERDERDDGDDGGERGDAGRRGAIRVSHPEILFILGTTLVTVLWDLNIAVISFAILFHLGRRRYRWEDLTPVTETAGVRRED